MDVRRRKIWHMYGPQTLLEVTHISTTKQILSFVYKMYFILQFANIIK